MSDLQWLAATDPEPMLEFLQGKASDRKMRLFACACCQTYQPYFTDERSWAAVEVALQVADGMVAETERERAFVEARYAANWTYDSDAVAEIAAYTCGDRAQLNDVPWRVMRAFAFDIYTNPRQLACRLLRDIFGNPFHPVTLDPRWLSSTVLDIAHLIYNERQFERLPILADALMDAGCDSEEVINHCRGEGPHVRGCWVVDLLLEKE